MTPHYTIICIAGTSNCFFVCTVRHGLTKRQNIWLDPLRRMPPLSRLLLDQGGIRTGLRPTSERPTINQDITRKTMCPKVHVKIHFRAQCKSTEICVRNDHNVRETVFYARHCAICTYLTVIHGTSKVKMQPSENRKNPLTLTT